eukprot:11213893-Lingulodinium_polyedra.AAC.1
MMLGDLPGLVVGGTSDIDGEESLCPAPTSAMSLDGGVFAQCDPAIFDGHTARGVQVRYAAQYT